MGGDESRHLQMRILGCEFVYNMGVEVTLENFNLCDEALPQLEDL